MTNVNHNFVQWLAPIDTHAPAMRADLLELVNINSGSANVAGVNRLGEIMRRHFDTMDVSGTRHRLPPVDSIDDRGTCVQRPLGDAWTFRQRPHAPMQVLLCGHLDTVFGESHPFQQVREVDGDRLNGPGVSDLKGGMVVMLNALAVLERSPWREHIGWEVLLNPDEEIGSPGSASLLADAATRHHAGLVFEPAMPDGSLAGRRKGSGNFTVVVRGRSAHAGREHHLGRNALRALADCLTAIDKLNAQRDGVTVNPAFAHGGGANNVVPDLGLMRFNVRIEQVRDEHWFLREFDAIMQDIGNREGIEITRHGWFGRKPKVLSAATEELFQLTADCGKQLGQSITWKATGGCCDGNNLAAAGLPNVDTLGVVGGAIHSSDEYVELTSLVPRARLNALLLMRLAAGHWAPPATDPEPG